MKSPLFAIVAVATVVIPNVYKHLSRKYFDRLSEMQRELDEIDVQLQALEESI